MIESLAKAAETAKPFSQSSESFNPDARLSSVEKNTVQKPDTQHYGTDRRIEATQNRQETATYNYDPDQRIEQQQGNADNTEAVKLENPENRQRSLSEEEKKQLKEETGWSDEIINAIGSKEKAEIYKKAGLKESEINGKKCFIRDDIDMEQKDEYAVPIKKEWKTVLLRLIKTVKLLNFITLDKKQMYRSQS